MTVAYEETLAPKNPTLELVFTVTGYDTVVVALKVETEMYVVVL